MWLVIPSMLRMCSYDVHRTGSGLIQKCYRRQQTNIDTIINVIIQTTQQKYENMFSGLDTLININNCDNAIKEQYEKGKFSKSKHTLAVIIRKRQTKNT